MSLRTVLRVSFDCGLGGKTPGQDEALQGVGWREREAGGCQSRTGMAAVTEQECGGCFHGMPHVEALAFQPLLDGSFCRQ